MRDVAVVGITVLFCVGGFLLYGKAVPPRGPVPPQAPIPWRSINRLAAPVLLSRQFIEALDVPPDVPEPPQDLVDELLQTLTPPQSGVSVFRLVDSCRKQLDSYPDASGVLVLDWSFNPGSIMVSPWIKERPGKYQYLVQLADGAEWVWPLAISKPKLIGFDDADTNGPD